MLLSAIATIVVIGLAVGITLLLTRSSGRSSELFLESATSTGADPFTDSTATGNATPRTTRTPTTAPSEPTQGQAIVGTVDGSTAGLYGGTLDAASCDREKQISFLAANPDKAAAFASVLGISANQIPDYIRALTSVVLRHDTRVTNHGLVDGSASSFQSVLQAGTAVLLDKQGIPRVRCNCGNPLTPPAAIDGDVRYHGQNWPGFALNQTVVIRSDPSIDIKVFVLVDIQTGEWFDRPSATDGTQDRPHESGGGTAAGGGVGTCASTSEDAVKRLLDARRRDDRADAAICASVNVLGYLWGLSDDFARTLTVDHCEPADPTGVSNSDRFDKCFLSNNAFLVGYQISLAPASNWIFNGIGLIDGRPPSTSRPPTTGSTATPSETGSGCGSSTKSLAPRTPAEEVLVNYFNAINARDYAAAWGYLASRVQARYGSQNAFAAMMSEHVACVRVLDIKVATNLDDPNTPPDIAVSASLGIQWYKVQFADQYVTPFPAGSGSLPSFWKVEANTDEGAPPPRILDSATGP